MLKFTKGERKVPVIVRDGEDCHRLRRDLRSMMTGSCRLHINAEFGMRNAG